MEKQKAELKLERWDREPGGDHNYGEPIDKLMEELVGGSEQFDRSAHNPIAKIPEVDASVELHEDGPLILFLVEQIPAILGATAALISAWVAWKSSRSLANQDEQRSVIIKIGKHEYRGSTGKKEELEKIFSFLASL